MTREEAKDFPVRMHPRQGEGVIIETSRRMIPLPNGTSTFEIALELGRAPVPERKYVANTASAVYEDGILYLLFGQHAVGYRRRLRTLVEISVSSVGALMFLKSLEPIREQIAKFRRQAGFEHELEDIPEEPDAPQTVALAANLILVAFSGREAVMDFYYASPFVLSQLQKNGKYAVDQVVRVVLPSGLLFSLIAAIEKFKEKFPRDEVEALGGLGREAVVTSEVRHGSQIIR